MRFPYHGAGIGLVMDGRLLIGKRADHPFYGTWAVPGGGRESFDADEFSNAVRELREETGIDFSLLHAQRICTWSLKVPFFSWTTYYFSIESFDQQLRPSEFSELKWVPIPEIKKKHLRPFMGSEVRCLSENL